MAHPGHIRKLTYEDYCLYPNDGNRHEIIDGEHYLSRAPRTAHQRIVVNLTRILSGHARRDRLGEILAAPLDVLLSQVDVVQPDVIFVSAGRAPAIITEKNIQGSPDLLIEVISTRRSIPRRAAQVASVRKVRRRRVLAGLPRRDTVDHFSPHGGGRQLRARGALEGE